VTTTPANAKVTVDDTAVDGGDYAVDLHGEKEKVVEVRVALDGYEPTVQQATLSSGTDARLSVTLREDPPRKTPNLKDVVLIPAGEFKMGSDESKNADERPAHAVYLEAYYISKNLVTVGQYRDYCKITRVHVMPYDPGSEHNNDPMILVTWNEAQQYAEWAGARLPTEAEWEKAARGTDGRIYPWGNRFDKRKCAIGAGAMAVVGSYPEGASPYGVLDMVGNTYQWCADLYDRDYYKSAPKSNPTGPSIGSSRARRGCSWQDGSPDSAGAPHRSAGAPYDRDERCGIRLVWPVPDK
jgi:formylglycine-generating enzyme required for sulfatase activity